MLYQNKVGVRVALCAVSVRMCQLAVGMRGGGRGGGIGIYSTLSHSHTRAHLHCLRNDAAGSFHRGPPPYYRVRVYETSSKAFCPQTHNHNHAGCDLPVLPLLTAGATRLNALIGWQTTHTHTRVATVFAANAELLCHPPTERFQEQERRLRLRRRGCGCGSLSSSTLHAAASRTAQPHTSSLPDNLQTIQSA